MAVDPDGRKIIVPNVEDREPILKMINQLARGSFKFNDKGELILDNYFGDSGSGYYRDRLIAAMGNSKDIEIRIQAKFFEPTLSGVLGNNNRLLPGNARNGQREITGGITITHPRTNNAFVFISGENDFAYDVNNNRHTTTPSEILLHELIGHAIPYFWPDPTSNNAIELENKDKSELPKHYAWERKADPYHTVHSSHESVPGDPRK